MVDRFKEPSTWAGFGTLLLAIGTLFKSDEALLVGTNVVEAASAGVGAPVIVGSLFASLAAVFLGENNDSAKKGKKG